MAELLRRTEMAAADEAAEPAREDLPAPQLDDAPRRLLACCREIAALGEAGSLLENLPRLALALCGAARAQLLEVDGNGPSTTVVASHGLALRTPPEQVLRHARTALDVQRPRETHLQGIDSGPGHAAHQVLTLCLPGVRRSRLVLVLEREPRASFHPREIRDLEIFACFCASALARNQAEAALQTSRAVESALAREVPEAVIVLDAQGVVRALSGAAAGLIGRGKEAIGQRLRELPGLAPLALALGAGTRAPDALELFSRKMIVRVRRFESGLSVTLRDATPGPAREHGAQFHLDDLLGDSPLMVRTREKAQQVADSELPILVTGETGTGKEILAQALHNASSRAADPFVAVNLSALPRELLESELFGYAAGAFTGASAQGNPGMFELARNGTLLLDEVGDLPLEMQPKLLRVLQERVVQRLGGSRARHFSARVIASTNRDLEQDVREGRFRLDLLHRLRVVHLSLPPLRERGGDLRLLVAQRLRRLAQRTGRPAIRVAPEVMAALEAYRWPGNVRELVNVLECEVGLLPPGKDVIENVPEAIQRSLLRLRPPPTLPEPATLAGAEREACIRALRGAGWNVARAAAILEVAKATLYSKIKRYGIAFPEP